MFKIKIYSDELVDTVDGRKVPRMLLDSGAEYSHAPDEPMLFATLRRLLMSFCIRGDEKISVQIWDEQRQRWVHPAGKVMPESWDGLLPVNVRVQIGSANL